MNVNNKLSLHRVERIYETGQLQQSDSVSREIRSIETRKQKDYKVFKKLAYEMNAQKPKVLKISDVESVFQLLGCLQMIAVLELIVELRERIFNFILFCKRCVW